MDNYKKFGFVSGQILMGVIFGFAAVIVTALLATLYQEFGGHIIEDLSTRIFYCLYGGYIGMQMGIGFWGYKFLKEKGGLKDFKRFFGQSVVGLTIGLLMFYYFFLSPGHIDNFLKGLLAYFGPVMPMIGAIIGFDIGLVKRVHQIANKNE